MAISEGNLSAADIAAVTGNGGFGGFGDNSGWWLILLFLFAFGGWGNNGFGNGYGGGNTGFVVNDVQRGFDQSAIMSGIAGVQTSLSNGFSNAEVSRCNSLANLTNQINQIAMAQQNCCCENRAATADLKYTVATEACADRAAVTDALQNVLTTLNGGIQSIKDQMCQDKIDSKNEEIANLRTQINLSNLAASQNAQTAALIADNTAQTQALINRIAPYPVPSYTVNPPYYFGSYGYTGYGCGCGA